MTTELCATKELFLLCCLEQFDAKKRKISPESATFVSDNKTPTSRDLSAPLPGTEASVRVYSTTLRQPVALNGFLLRKKRPSKRRHVKRADSSLCEEGLIQPQQIQGDLGSSSAGNKRLKQDTWRD